MFYCLKHLFCPSFNKMIPLFHSLSCYLQCNPPLAQEPGGLQSMGSQRIGHYWANKHGTVQGHRSLPSLTAILYLRQPIKCVQSRFVLVLRDAWRNLTCFCQIFGTIFLPWEWLITNRSLFLYTGSWGKSRLE